MWVQTFGGAATCWGRGSQERMLGRKHTHRHVYVHTYTNKHANMHAGINM